MIDPLNPDFAELPRHLFSIESEQEVLAAMMVDPNCTDDVLDIVEASDFYNAQNRRIFSEIIHQRDASPHIDMVTLLTELGGEDVGYAIEIYNNRKGTANVTHYAGTVAERARLRRLREALQDSAEQVMDPTAKFDELAEAVQTRLIALDSKDYESQIQDVNPVIKRTLTLLDDRWRNRSAGIIPGLSTGLHALDERYNGLRDGHLVILAARPSMGKSALAMQISQHAAVIERKNVLVFSLEMPSEELHERMMATQGNLPYSKIRSGDLNEEDWPKLSVGATKLKDAPIRTVDTPGLHINQIRAYARKAHRSNPLSLVVVDHINIVKGDNGNGREREIASISGGLKNLAKELNCPVLALCQLNRDCEKRPNKRPLMSDLRESGAIEQDADIVTFMYRDDYYDQDSPQKGVVELITRKYRGGQVGTDYLYNRLEVMRIEDMTHQYEPPAPRPVADFDL